MLRAFALNPLLVFMPPLAWLLWHNRHCVARHQALMGYALGTSLVAWTIARNVLHI
jgi:hypothetical protein